MPRNKKRKGTPITVHLECRECGGSGFLGNLYSAPKLHVTSRGMKHHFSANIACRDAHTHCMDTFNGHHYDYNFINCLSKEFKHLAPSVPSSPPFSAEQFGLTMTSNCPVSRTTISSTSTQNGRKKTMHEILNSQTVSQGLQLPISWRTIYSALQQNSKLDSSRHIAEDISSSDDESDSEFLRTSGANQTNNQTDNEPMSGANQTNNPSDIEPEKKLKKPPILISSPQTHHEDLPVKLQVETELMKLMGHHKLPLVCFKEIFQWAMKSQKKEGFDFASLPHARSRKTILKHLKKCVPESNCLKNFGTKSIKWLPDNTDVDLSVREFPDALSSLLNNKSVMKEENISMPHSCNPYSPHQFPEVDDMSELHHGSWWSDSWNQLCKDDTNEILVPVILYLDGISVDAHGRLTLTPLNMTLGIFNTATRQRPEAWETLYFHPDHNYLSSHQSSPATPADNLQNLHN